MYRRILCSFIVIIGLCYQITYAQISPSFTQFFINPYRINSSYAGIEGRPTVYVAYRQQWTGIEGAPRTATFSFHAPLNYGVNFGFDFYNDSRSIINTNSFLITAGYVISFSNKEFLRFGLSGGLGFRNIDLSEVDNPSDPALLNVVENNLFLNGNFGISFQTGYLTVGVSMPNLFEPNLNNTSSFENGKIAPLQEIIANASYRFYFALDDMAFEPHIIYRYSDISPYQYEAAGIIHMKHAIWFGGSFRQDYGISALFGIKIKNQLVLGYSYGLGNASLPGIGKSTHEFNMSMQLGQQRRSRNIRKQNIYLSFIDTERIYGDLGTQRRRTAARRTKTRMSYRPPVKTTAKDESPKTDSESTVNQSDHDDARFSVRRDMIDRNVADIPTETIQIGDHPLELTRGNYIIVKEFLTEDQAQEYSDQLTENGHRSGYGYLTTRSKWLVYVYRSDTKIGLRRQAQKFNSDPDFSDTWILYLE